MPITIHSSRNRSAVQLDSDAIASHRPTRWPMKREVTRNATLHPFALDVPELQSLCLKLIELFDSDQEHHIRIVFHLPDETLSFDSSNDLNDVVLRRNVTSFYVSIDQWSNRKSIRFSSGSFLNFRPTVSATASSEAWCAAAVETVVTMARNNRRWYHWLHSLPLGYIIIIASNVPTIMALVGAKEITRQYPSLNVAWLAALLSLTIVWALRPRLLPGATIAIGNHETFLKRHAGELSLLIAALSAVITLIGLFTSSK